MDREELKALVDDGASIRAIAGRLGQSPTNIRYWLKKHGLRTRRTLALDQARAARVTGEREVTLTCAVHGLTTFRWRNSDGCFRCLRCRTDAVVRRRRRVKEVLVDE